MNYAFDPTEGIIIISSELKGPSGSVILRLALETLEKVDPPNERMRFPADFCPRKNAASKAGFRLIQESL